MRRLRNVLLTLILAGFGVFAAPVPACACTCPGFTLAEAVEEADVVFTGVVRDVDRPLPLLGGTTVTAQFAVSAVYKGAVPENASVQTHAQGPACGFDFADGAAYVIFADRDGETLSTSSCDGNFTLNAGDEPPELMAMLPSRAPLPATTDWSAGRIALFSGAAVIGLVAAGLGVRRIRRRGSRVPPPADVG